jgi:hypothetical protein
MTRATTALAAGIGFGAGLMYFFDPNRGSRRRTHARNQVLHASHRLRDSARTQWQSLRREAEGLDDRVLAERARAMLGRVVSHAHALAVDASRGVVTVSGPILRDEMRRTTKALKHVPGVRRVVNALEPHPAPRRMPAMPRDRRLAWAGDRLAGNSRRIAAALAGAAGLGLAARAAMQARGNEIELRS